MNFKKFLINGIIAVAVLVVGLILVCTIGFNRGFDFTGGTVITINTTTYKTSEAYNKINKILSDNKLSAFSLTESENDNGQCVVVKYQINEELERNQKVLDEIYASFGYDKTSELESTYVKMISQTTPAQTSLIFSNAFLACLITFACVAVYMFLRHGLASGFTLIASGVLDIGFMLSLTAITRVQVNAGIAIAIASVLTFSLLLNFMQINKFNRKTSEEKFAKMPNMQVAEICVKENFFTSIITSAGIAVALLLVAIFVGGAVWGIAFPVILGLIAVVLTANFITPYLWSIAYTKRTRAPKQKQAVQLAQVETDPDFGE